MNWIKESNRIKHFGYAIPCALLLRSSLQQGWLLGIEFKDRSYGGKWDWLDLIATLLGGTIGQALQCILVYLALKTGCL